MSNKSKLSLISLSIGGLLLLYYFFPQQEDSTQLSQQKKTHPSDQKTGNQLPSSLTALPQRLRIPASATSHKKETAKEQFARMREFLKQKHKLREKVYKPYVDLKKYDLELFENFEYSDQESFKVTKDLRALPEHLFVPSMGTKILLQSKFIIFKPKDEIKSNFASRAVAVKYNGEIPIFGIINPYLIIQLKEEVDPTSVVEDYGLVIQHRFDKIRTYSVFLKEDTQNTEKLFATEANIHNDPRVLSSKVDIFSAIIVPL